MEIEENDIINNAAVCRLHILSFVRKSWLNWIGYVDRMDNKGEVSKIFKNTQESQLRG
jgi:hypothetical protein